MNKMMFLKDRLSPQRRVNVRSRFQTILTRYGLNARKLANAIFHYVWLTRQYNTAPTFPITAAVVEKHAALLRQLQFYGAQFAIHGLEHVDYSLLTGEQIQVHLEKAIQIFEANQINYAGFRFPYLKKSPDYLNELAAAGFKWDSSEVVNRNPFAAKSFLPESWQAYQFMLEDYQNSGKCAQVSIPREKNGLIEIPVTLPDDDLLVDRLEITDPEMIAAGWDAMFDRIHENNELFVLQFHPERFFLCEAALDGLLNKAQMYGPDVWLASLDEIAEWWRERANFQIVVNQIAGNRFQISTPPNSRTTVLLKNAAATSKSGSFLADYSIIATGNSELECSRKPVVGIAPGVPLEMQNILKNEGFIFEQAVADTQYGFYLAASRENASLDETELINRIQQVKNPLLRVWRWPNQARSAFSVSGDIDCLTYLDFFSRVWEN